MDESHDKYNGYVRFDNQLLEAMCRLDISGRQLRILMAVFRKTIGFNLDVDWISASQLADLMQYDGATTHLHADLRLLKERKIIITQGRKIGINKQSDQWFFSKIETNQNPSLNKPKSVTPKETKNGQVSDRNRSEKVTENGHHKRHKYTKPKNTITPFSSPQENFDSQSNQTSQQRKVTQRATVVPDHFAVTPELVQWANEKSIHVDLGLETEKFLNYHRAKGSSFKCWVSAWRNWMLKAQSFTTEKSVQRMPSTPSSSTAMNWDDTSWRHDLGL
ncbi:replication protein [Zooshikella marina]|uniref:replication protein n=1 Tax=Zooshikella ganghwensis TaxID=202772 RepID=UPI001BB01589|nr:replication protein [Zooshikella ganghwensis]MBU2707696.1 replication protein [Zooshikella ganghwensis]